MKLTASIRPLVSSLLFAVAAAPACASTASTSSSGVSADALVASVCDYQARCAIDYSAMLGGQTRVVAGFVLDAMSGAYLDMCSESGRAAFVAELAYLTKLPGAATLDFAAGKAALDRAACGDRIGMPPAVGARTAGQSCLDSVQCATSACTDMDGRCGVCVTPLAVGAACSNSDQARCVEGANCTGGRCVADSATKNAGDACAAASECPQSKLLRCENRVCTSVEAKVGEPCGAQKVCRASVCDAGTGTCVALKTSGACTSSAQCDSFHGYACADATKTCVRFTGAVVRAKQGEACGEQPGGGSRTKCAPGLTCDEATSKCIDAASTCTAS